MTDELDLSLEHAGLLFAAAMRIVVRMDQDENDRRRPSAAIPKDMMCYAEALMLVPAVMVLTAKLYPALLDPETLRDVLQGARPELLN